MAISQEMKCMFVWIILVLAWPSVGRAEVPVTVTIDPQIIKQFHAQVKTMEVSKSELVRSSAKMKDVLQGKGNSFKGAEEGSQDQFNAAQGMLDGILDGVEAQVGPLEAYSKDLAKMQAINTAAQKSAKPDEGATRGSRSEVAAYNDMVETFEGWDSIFSQFGSPELERSRNEMKKSVKAMRNELLIAKANGNRFTYDTFRKLDSRLLDYRLQLNSYVSSLKGMVTGIAQARQTGQFNETFASLDNLLNSIDGTLIPEFLSPAFSKAIELIARGQAPAGSEASWAAKNTESYDNLYIKD